ncbi:MAG: pitrilysin family protein, partial [Clostridiales bacterium]
MLVKHKLKNGLRVVCESIDYVRSVSIGIWVKTGSSSENDDNNGVSHFIEHMLFKGTNNRNAKQIAESIDSIGGHINAFTGKECTCYYAKTLDTHLNSTFDVLADMFLESKFKKEDIEIEKKIVLEEINMYEDSPEELVHDLLHETVWESNSLGYPILGTSKTLVNLNREDIINYKNQNYIPENVVIAAVGNFDIDKFIKLVEKYFDSWNPQNLNNNNILRPAFKSDIVQKNKETEQVHLCMGFDGIEHGNEKLYSLMALNNIFGGGMSSRLFQKIREEEGLAYSIYTYPSSYKEAGLYTIYSGMNPDYIEKVIDLIKLEIKEISKNGISEKELNKAKEQLKGNYIMGLESTSSRMHSLGKSEIVLNRVYDIDKIISYIDGITINDIKEIVREIFDFNNVGISVVGNI